MRILLFGTELKEDAGTAMMALLEALSNQSFTIYRYAGFKSEIAAHAFDNLVQIHTADEMMTANISVVISAGGDGTMLKAAAFVGNRGLPLLGFNLGRLGFLAVMDKGSLSLMVSSLKQGNYTIGERITLQIQASPSIFEPGSFALNDFTIMKRDNSSMIRIFASLNGEYLNTYWADGIILATPTGSTGYSLSCGGPIVFPGSGNFVLTPIAPHNLNVRPVVIADDGVLEFNVEGRSDNFLCTLDSSYALITHEHKIILKKNSFGINLIQIQGHSFQQTLRNKLLWGLDIRN